ncbi:hypothetical protein KL86PLE_60361 [uncultured Pleomorphomonas sp.]|uniref:Uncharacterized protein n=1 Tax=uncultured Pleomorphomonas sp. TaxID=442121 RepID=A0A212LKZ8_9HYPH|nr:hypothetical protein [uncultured Pleomorphomonas sp.]SCM78039.1 hypothetical protein KL86PLE_60361 [uncultured Pleomorphomonas sp.]
MTFGAAPVAFFKRRMTAPRAAVAFLSALLFVVALHLGLGVGAGSSAATTLGAADHAVLRHPLVVRDGIRPVVAAEHGDRTSAPPPPQPPAALASVAAVAVRARGFCRLRPGTETISAYRRSAGHRPRAPPIAA